MSERINTPFTNEHFVAFCEKMVGQPYWYGSVVYKCTENLRARKAKQYPAHYGSSRTARYRDDIAKKKVCADCVGLIKGYNWTNGGQGVIESIGTDKTFSSKYGAHGCPDKSANGMFSYARSKGCAWGTMDTLPEVPGIALRFDGHVGVYIGGGYAVEERGFNYGCVKTKVSSRKWTHWYQLPFVDYGDAVFTGVATKPDTPTSEYTLGTRTLKKGSKGADVKALQEFLLQLGYSLPRYGADGDFGGETAAAIKRFQARAGLAQDGVYGGDTHKALMDAVADHDAGKEPAEPAEQPEPSIARCVRIPAFSARPRRVAAYARVSTSSEEQLTSYEAQVKHYTEYIKSKESSDNWQFVDVYTDKGITGVSTKKREGFNRMIQDALAGKIDLIITKSVSRFARNTVDTLTAIRKLKEYGVEVYFEEQNIYTLDGKGEVLLTIMSSIAQEESRNISENVTWGMRKRFADGKVTMPYGQFMGYRRGKDGTPEVVEAEADIVRTIFRRFLEGATPAMISRELNLAGIPCPSRKSLLSENEAEIAKARKRTSRWGTSTVENILANEKYKGDAILQKTYCTDYLLKTFVVNDGSVVPKYYAQNSHPAIVSPEVFDLAQQEMAWRRSLNGRYSGRSCFASRVVCGDCGAFYGSKVWHSTDEYRRMIWRCNNKYTGETKCTTPHVTQEALEKAFVQVMQQVLSQKEGILTACHEALDEAFDTTELDKAATRLQDQALGMAERVRQLVEENARVQRDQEKYQREYEALVAEHEKFSQQIQDVEAQRKDKADRSRKIEVFLRMLEEQAECMRFESYTFVALVDKVVIRQDGKLEIIFRNGMKYEYSIVG